MYFDKKSHRNVPPYREKKIFFSQKGTAVVLTISIIDIKNTNLQNKVNIGCFITVKNILIIKVDKTLKWKVRKTPCARNASLIFKYT